MADQLRLLTDVKGWLCLPVLVVANKSDLVAYEDADMTMSTLSGDGVAAVLDRMVEMLEKSCDDLGANVGKEIGRSDLHEK